MNSKVVSVVINDGIGTVVIDHPPVNAISLEVREGLLEALESMADDESVKAVVLTGAGRCFSAGADINEFGKSLVDPSLRDLVSKIESMKMLVIAAIHGTTLGGGVEIALACHFRCAASGAKLGLPEVKLGLLPGAGGTQRLPRLIGVEAALDLMVSGRSIGAAQAAKVGLVDVVLESEDFRGAAHELATRLVSDGTELTRIGEFPPPSAADELLTDYRQRISMKSKGLLAPGKIVDAVEFATSLTYQAGMQMERKLFLECLESQQSKALRHLFFAEREVGNIPGIDQNVESRDIKEVGIIGAGTMGGGIAMNFLNIGVPVTLLDTDSDAVDRGTAVIRGNYARTVKKGRMASEDMEMRMELLQGSTSYEDISGADLVIEAVYESMDVKRDVFAKMDRHCKAGAILASNTSTLDLNEIANSTARPEDVIGLHFFSPANVMRLLEIVRGEKTANDVVATSMRLSKIIGKIGVLSGVCFGFIGNRMLEGYGREVGFMLLEGASPEQIDRVVTDFGFPMGPNTMMDLAGIDIGYKVRNGLREAGELPDDERYGCVPDRLAEMGRFGQKTGAGIYSYGKDGRTPENDPLVDKLINAEAKHLGIEQREFTDTEILQRCIYPIINEGARVLEEGISLRAGDIDIVWVNGYGFPPYRGGPMHYADAVGLASILEKIGEFGDTLDRGHGYWEPANLLIDLARDGATFADWRSV